MIDAMSFLNGWQERPTYSASLRPLPLAASLVQIRAPKASGSQLGEHTSECQVMLLPFALTKELSYEVAL
jgi:hypothetical protein